MTTAQRTARQNSAIRKAQQLRWWLRVDGDPRYGWIVDSTSRRGAYYMVGPDYRCECAAGRAGAPCVHAASCFLARYGLGGVRVTVKAAA